MSTELALIQAVRRRPELYDKYQKNYTNRNHIHALWEDISMELSGNSFDLRKRWTSLRDYFQKSRRESANAPAGSLKRKKKWYLYDDMAFLLPHLSERKTATHTSVASSAASDDDCSDLMDLECVSPGSSHDTKPTPERLFVAPCSPAEQEEPLMEPTNPPESSVRMEIPARKRAKFTQEQGEKRRASEFDQQMLKAIQSLCERSNGARSAEKDNDEDELFWKSMLPKMKLLSTVDKMKCQSEIFMTVIKYVERSSVSNGTSETANESPQTPR